MATVATLVAVLWISGITWAVRQERAARAAEPATDELVAA